jgi:hypothetical protein
VCSSEFAFVDYLFFQMSNNSGRQAMSNKEIGTAEPHPIEEVAWQDVWLRRVLIDRGIPSPTSRRTDDTSNAMSARQRRFKE